MSKRGSSISGVFNLTNAQEPVPAAEVVQPPQKEVVKEKVVAARKRSASHVKKVKALR